MTDDAVEALLDEMGSGCVSPESLACSLGITTNHARRILEQAAESDTARVDVHRIGQAYHIMTKE